LVSLCQGSLGFIATDVGAESAIKDEGGGVNMEFIDYNNEFLT
jgi:hypothetical protein